MIVSKNRFHRVDFYLSCNRNSNKQMFGGELTNCLITFKKEILTFLNEMIEQFPEESDVVVMRVFLDTQVEIRELMHQFVKYVLPHKGLIETKNESFFLEKGDIFGTVDRGKVLHCKRIWTSGRMDKEDKQVMWAWFASFVRISEKYVELSKKLQ